jgi:hypothetical protein
MNHEEQSASVFNGMVERYKKGTSEAEKRKGDETSSPSGIPSVVALSENQSSRSWSRTY